MEAAEARVWWAEVSDLRERIERRRADELAARRRIAGRAERVALAAGERPRRTITITGQAAPAPAAVPLRLVERDEALDDGLPEWGAGTRPRERSRTVERHAAARRRPRRTPAEWLGARPDRVAAWAVALGALLVIAGILGH